MAIVVDNPAELRLKAFTRLMRTASTLYHANPTNPPQSMNIADDDVLRLLESFSQHYERAMTVTFEGIAFRVIQLNDLITEKLATGRPKDISDADELINIKKRNEA